MGKIIFRHVEGLDGPAQTGSTHDHRLRDDLTRDVFVGDEQE